MAQYPLINTFLLSVWLEALIYGFFLCLFCWSVYVNVRLRKFQNRHSKTMFYISCLMFVIATAHIAMNCFRLKRGFIDHANTPGGPVAYIGKLSTWDHILKDTLYATQSILGDAAAVYRCYILYNGNWWIIALPFALSICSMISGYTVCGLYSTVDPNATVFNPRLQRWIRTFYAIAVVQNILTTSLMAYRIWSTDRKSSAIRASGSLLPILRILVESAALYLFVEILQLSFYVSDYNPQYFLLEAVCPIVGITFNAITIRIALRSQNALRRLGGVASLGPTSEHQTIGHMPMRHIAVNITKEVDDHRDSPNDDTFTTLNETPRDRDKRPPSSAGDSTYGGGDV